MHCKFCTAHKQAAVAAVYHQFSTAALSVRCCGGPPAAAPVAASAAAPAARPASCGCGGVSGLGTGMGGRLNTSTPGGVQTRTTTRLLLLPLACTAIQPGTPAENNSKAQKREEGGLARGQPSGTACEQHGVATACWLPSAARAAGPTACAYTPIPAADQLQNPSQNFHSACSHPTPPHPPAPAARPPLST